MHLLFLGSRKSLALRRFVLRLKPSRGISASGLISRASNNDGESHDSGRVLVISRRCQQQDTVNEKSKLIIEWWSWLMKHTHSTRGTCCSVYLACSGLQPSLCVLGATVWGALEVRQGGRGAALGRKSSGFNKSSLLFISKAHTQDTVGRQQLKTEARVSLIPASQQELCKWTSGSNQWLSPATCEQSSPQPQYLTCFLCGVQAGTVVSGTGALGRTERGHARRRDVSRSLCILRWSEAGC